MTEKKKRMKSTKAQQNLKITLGVANTYFSQIDSDKQISNMIKSMILFLFISILLSCTTTKKEELPPNIIYFLADDLGYGEVGVYGQKKIQTPNIDALAKNGMMFTQHYSGAPVCAPARYVFLTGKHTGHAFIRGNDEWAERGDVWDYAKASLDPKLEGQRPIPANTVTLGKLLKKSIIEKFKFKQLGDI